MLSHPPLFEGSSLPLADTKTPRRNSGVDFILETSKRFSNENRLVVLTIGVNNMWTNDAPEKIAEGTKKIVETLRQKLPAAKILLLSILPAGQSNSDSNLNINTKTNNNKNPKEGAMARLTCLAFFGPVEA